MELLILLLGELIFAPFVAALGILIQLLVVGTELALELVALLVTGRRRRAAPRTPRRWLRRTRWALLGVTGATLAAAFLAGTCFVRPLVDWIAARVGARTGIEIRYDAVGGNLFFGDIAFDGLRVVRREHPHSTFDLRAARCAIEMNLLSALASTLTLDAVRLEQVRGHYERRTKPDRLAPRRPFVVHDLQIRDLEVRWVDRAVRHGIVDLPLRIDRAHSQPLRSRYAIFDLLFRSNLDAQLADRPFAVTTEAIPDGRRTTWRGTGLPLEVASHWIGGPLRWIESGALDVHLDDEWQRGATIGIDSHCVLTLRDVRAAVPEGTGRIRATAAAPLVAWLNRRDRPVRIEFDLTIDEQKFDGLATLLQTDFLDKVADAMRATLGVLTGR